MDQVVVTGEKKLRRTNTVALGIKQMSMGQIKSIPAFMGEPDVVKAMLTLPGITSVGEGASGFNVRGGNVDENLIMHGRGACCTTLLTCWVSFRYSTPMR